MANYATAPASFVTHLECSATGETFPHDTLWGLSPAGAPLLVRYDLQAAGNALDKDALRRRPSDMWRFRELLPLPVGAEKITLGESVTPLVSLKQAAEDLGLADIIFKDESRLPTGSFKARGMAMAVSMAHSFGVKRMALPTAGNAGAAAAAYAARAGMQVDVFMPADTPAPTVEKIAFHGANGHFVDGLIDRCGVHVREGKQEHGWHDLSTLAEPYRIEGKKTMGLEMAEQLGWRTPDVIYYPTGGGTGFIGMWKAFKELRDIGWLEGDLPRMVAVQSDGCRPIIDAFERGLDHVPEPWTGVDTKVHGVRVPKPLGDRLIMQVIRESVGHASFESDHEAMAAQAELARQTGFAACLEGALCYATLKKDRAQGRVKEGETVVIFNTGVCLQSSEL